MPAAKVRTFERNYSLRVAGDGGVYSSIAIPAKKGPVSTPILVSSEKDLLEIFTPNKTIEVGYNMAYYSALAVLQKSDKLWVTRVAKDDAEMGGVLFYDETKSNASTQVNETSPEVPLITFAVSNIVDGSDKVLVSAITGGVEADLEGRIINIEGVTGSFTVSAVAGSELTLDTAVTSSVSFVGTGSGTFDASVDYLGFDADFGTGNSTEVEVSNLTSGNPSDLVGAQLALVADGVRFSRSVVSVAGSTLTLDTVTPAITAPVGNGYKGFPASSVSVTGIVDSGDTVQLSGILPVYVTMADFDGKILDIVADMSDATSLLVSAIVSNVSGSTMDFDGGFNNPTLIDNSTGEAPFAEAQADGFESIETINQTDSLFAITASDVGEWIQDIRIEILTGNEVRNENAFMIRVFHKNNLNVPVEQYTVCRTEGRKDGFGRNMYLDTVLEGSRLISGLNNTLIDGDVLPVETVTRDVEGRVISRTFLKIIAGTDGSAVTDSDMITAADLMNNKNNYPVTLFLDGGWSTPAYQLRLAEISEIRDDAVAILSVPYDREVSITHAKDIVDYRNLELAIFSTYAALYSCHVNITDKYNDRNIYVSPDGYAAAAVCESKANYEIWYPPAGFKRGKLFVNDTLVRFTDGELDYLSDNAVNPVRFTPGRGIAIWGQYTLGLTPSSLDRLNVRLLLNELKPAITAFLEHFLFELNSKGIRDLVVATIENYLSNIQARNGVYAYKVVCDDTNNSDYDIDNHTLNVDVFIKPTQSIEYINFTTILSSTGIEFENIG